VSNYHVINDAAVINGQYVNHALLFCDLQMKLNSEKGN